MSIFPSNTLPVVRLFIFVLTLSACTEIEHNDKPRYASIDFSLYPVMQCQVVFSYGSFFGYQPPSRDDSLIIDLSHLSQFNKLQFDSKKGSYIPLFDPLQITKVSAVSKTEMVDLRLVSQHQKGHKIIIDIDHYDTSKSVDSTVWIIEEDQVVRSVVLMECKFKAKLNS